jgi:RNA polymerase primary sigma factor
MDSSQPERSALSRYFSELRAYPPLSRERERRLARDARTSKVSRDRLIEANLGFVVKVATEYRNLGLPLEDLLNEGNLGLLEAAGRFDTSKGTKFITYAIWWIRKSILKALSERSALVRVPSYQLKKVREIRETERSLRIKLGRRVEREEISAKLARSMAKVDQALQLAVREVSLDHRVGQDRDQPISDYLVDLNCADAESDMIRREDSELIGEALRELTAQEQRVLSYRFGIDGGRPRTLKEVGDLMRISRERVRQIECQAKARLRKIFDGRRAIKSPPRAPRSVRTGSRAHH